MFSDHVPCSPQGLHWARHQGWAKLEMPSAVLSQAGSCLESVWDVHCSDIHALHTWGAKGLWKRQLLLCTLFSDRVAQGTFHVPCFLCQVHTSKLCSCSEYMYGPYERAITKTPESLWTEWSLTPFLLWSALAACGMLGTSISSARAQTQQSPSATAEGHTTKYSHQLLFKQVRKHMNYSIKKRKKKGGGWWIIKAIQKQLKMTKQLLLIWNFSLILEEFSLGLHNILTFSCGFNKLSYSLLTSY